MAEVWGAAVIDGDLSWMLSVWGAAVKLKVVPIMTTTGAPRKGGSTGYCTTYVVEWLSAVMKHLPSYRRRVVVYTIQQMEFSKSPSLKP